MTSDVLELRLGPTLVGHLTRSGSDERIELRFAAGYRSMYPRPVLGQWFIDRLSRTISSRQRLPPFFSNLLPEGALRELVAREADAHRSREFFLLARLGEDLPGALVVRPAESLAPSDGPGETIEVEPATAADGPLKFSLAGVQLKFSVLRGERRLTIPASGQGGDWIVKLPDRQAPNVPENEWSMMTLARQVGLDVPEVSLWPVEAIDGLPEGLSFAEPWAYVIRRFDRGPARERIHMEDFAQILGLYPEQKYSAHNYETIGNIVRVLAGQDAFDELVRRLVFVIAIGNGDAHHKNWSLLYPDGVHATLAPAYDLVSTLPYLPHDRLGLNLGRSKAYEDVTLQSFERLARKVGDDPARVADLVRQTVARFRDAWDELQGELRLPRAWRGALEAHVARVPLLRA